MSRVPSRVASACAARVERARATARDARRPRAPATGETRETPVPEREMPGECAEVAVMQMGGGLVPDETHELETQINLHWIISLTRNARTQHACLSQPPCQIKKRERHTDAVAGGAGDSVDVV